MSEMTQALVEPAAAMRGTSLWAMARHRFVRNKASMASLVILVLVATHDRDMIQRLGKRVITLERGRVASGGLP